MPFFRQLTAPDGQEIMIVEVWRGPKPAPAPSTRSSGHAVDVDTEIDAAPPIREPARADLFSLTTDRLIDFLRERGHL